MQNFVLPSDGSLRAKNALKLFQSTWKKDYAKSDKIWIYIDDNKSEHSSIPTDIFKPAKNFCEKFCTKEATFKTATTEFLSQIANRKNISDEQFRLWKDKILKTLQNL